MTNTRLDCLSMSWSSNDCWPDDPIGNHPEGRPNKSAFRRQAFVPARVEGDKGHFYLRAVSRRTAGENLKTFLTEIITTNQLPERTKFEFKVDTQGKPQATYFREGTGGPQIYDEFASQLHQQLFDSASAILSIARWRVDAYGAHQPIVELCNGYFSFDGKTFHELPLPGSMYIEIKREFCTTDDQKEQNVEYYEKNVLEPFAHRMFREAWSERLRSPRSALIAGVASLEIGVKEAIADLVPDAEWIVFKLPTPDVVSILREGLQTLPVRLKIAGKVVPLPDDILKQLRTAVTMRNNLAHAGKGKVQRDKVNDILCLIRDILSLFDYYRGHEWALCHVSSATLAVLPGIDLAAIQEKIRTEDRLQETTAGAVMQISDLPNRID